MGVQQRHTDLSFRLSRGIDRGLTTREIEMVWNMALIHTPDKEMAYSLDFKVPVWIDYKLKHPEIQQFINKARAIGSTNLRKAQFEAALGGNVPMQIWLGKCILGQNSTDFAQPTGQPLQLSDISPESKQHLLELRNAIYKKTHEVEVETELTGVNSNSDSLPVPGGHHAAESEQ